MNKFQVFLSIIAIFGAFLPLAFCDSNGNIPISAVKLIAIPIIAICALMLSLIWTMYKNQ